MKTILYRYLIREQLIPVSVCFLGLILILITGRLMQVTRYLFTSSVELRDFVELTALAVPKLSLYALPMATLVGVLLAFLRLKEDNELVAMRAAGLGFSRFKAPVLTVILISGLLSLFIAVHLMPHANRAFRHKLRNLGRASIPAFLQERTFIDKVPDLVFFFERVDPSNLSVEGIFIQDERNPEVSAAIVAQQARIMYREEENQLLFKISDGIITRVGDELEDAQTVSFRVYDFRLPLDELLRNPSEGPKHKGEMTLKELRRRMAQQGPHNPYRYALEFHTRLALPVSCLLLGLTAAPLGAIFRQGHRMAGATIGLVTFLTYYVLLSAGKGLGENGAVPPAVAIWTPNVLTFLLVCFLWRKMEKEAPLFSWAPRWRRRSSRKTQSE